MKKIICSGVIFTLLFFTTVYYPVIAQEVIPATWATQATQYGATTGQRYTFYFQPGGTPTGTVWGSGIYTTDCSIASAAVHAGLITPQDGGTVTIEILPGQNAYEGSTANGVTSYHWGSFGASFRFVNHHRNSEPIAATVIQGNWVTSASQYISNIGQQYSFYFPAGIVTTGQVWGSGIYTTDCSIASAAVHAGVLNRQRGGIVTIEILPGQNAYKGSLRNGVTSRDWPGYIASFRFITKRIHRH